MAGEGGEAGAEAGAFVAEEEGDVAAEVEFIEGLFAIEGGGDEHGEAGGDLFEVLLFEDGGDEVGAHGGAHDFGRPRFGASAGEVDGVHPRGGGGAEDGADVARILNIFQQQGALLVLRRPGPGRTIESQHARWRLYR